MKTRIMLIILIAVLAGCAGRTAKEPVNLEYEFAGISTGIPTLNAFKLYTDVKLTNPNDFYVDVEKMAYKVYVNGEEIAEGVSEEVLGLKKNETKYCKLKVNIGFKKIKENLLEAIKERTADVRIEGETVLKSGKQEYVYPFELERSFQK